MESYTKTVKVTTCLRAAVDQLNEALDMVFDDQEEMEKLISLMMDKEEK